MRYAVPVSPFTPELAEQRTGVAAEQIRQLARDMADIPMALSAMAAWVSRCRSMARCVSGLSI